MTDCPRIQCREACLEEVHQPWEVQKPSYGLDRLGLALKTGNHLLVEWKRSGCPLWLWMMNAYMEEGQFDCLGSSWPELSLVGYPQAIGKSSTSSAQDCPVASSALKSKSDIFCPFFGAVKWMAKREAYEERSARSSGNEFTISMSSCGLCSSSSWSDTYA